MRTSSLALAAAAGLPWAAAVNCSEPTAPAECCEMEAKEPCFIKDLVSPLHQCSHACQQRFLSLSWNCYQKFHVSHRWYTMQSNCDPGKLVKFEAPTQNISSGAKSIDDEKARNGVRLRTNSGDGNVGLVLGSVVAVCALFSCAMVASCWYFRRRSRLAAEPVVVDVSVRTTSCGSMVHDNVVDASDKQLPHISAWKDDIEKGKGQVQQEKQLPQSRDACAALPTPARGLLRQKPLN